MTDSVWKKVVAANPHLSVTLKFDHTCPLWKVREIMKPEVPVSNLFLETYTQIWPEIEIASDSYGSTLRKGKTFLYDSSTRQSYIV